MGLGVLNFRLNQFSVIGAAKSECPVCASLRTTCGRVVYLCASSRRSLSKYLQTARYRGGSDL